MAILVDNQPFAGGCEAQATVRQVAREACASHPAGRRILVGLRCGGRDLAPAELQASLELCAAGIEGLELLTADLREQVGIAVQEALELLGDTESRLGAVADSLEQGRQATGMRDLAGGRQVFRQVQDTVEAAAELLEIPLDQTLDAAGSTESCLNQIKGRLNDLKAAVSAQDLVQVADLLRYDFGASLAGWRTLLNKLGSEAQSPAAR